LVDEEPEPDACDFFWSPPMTRPRVTLLSTSLLAVALLAACASPTPVAPTAAAPVQTRAATPAPAPAPAATGAATGGAAQSGVSTVDLASRGLPAGAAAAGGAAALVAPSQRVVYFDFDSFAIKDEFQPVIEGHARVLARESGKRLVIEGHTDERGGREYNLALGQKRAEAVLRSLVLLGASERQLEAVSFGEERPAMQGNDESAWSRNRRAEMKDR
jgi:peptidoglycan-associated lipoprotein